MSEKNNIRSASGRTFSAELMEDNLLYVQINGDNVFELEDAKELLLATEELASGSKVYHLFDLDNKVLPSDEARDFAISDDGTAYSHAHAFVVRTVAQRISVNLIIRFQNPNVPIKLFNSVESAMNWIRILKAEKTLKS